ncbi:hypothetical protein KAR91_03055, partial [Candidatus Pacearchaeota archaeon]|nr:hypothetical protein [Candidatus Pacearchaeota archaeon]
MFDLMATSRYNDGGIASFYSPKIDQSCRFNDDDSARLYRTFDAPTNTKILTLNVWLKRCNLGTVCRILNPYVSANDWAYLGFNANNQIAFYNWNSPTDYGKVYSRLFRDIGSWFNIHLIIDTTNGTAADRQQVWINNERLTDIAIDYGDFTLDYTPLMNSAYTHQIGFNPDANQYSDFYLSNYYFIDGQALTPSDFEQSKYDIWIPKKYTGSYGTNGFCLDFANSADLGNDVSGNNNDFTS